VIKSEQGRRGADWGEGERAITFIAGVNDVN
jgi:hypothetical protein